MTYVTFLSAAFPNVYLRMDGKEVEQKHRTAQGYVGGIVNGQYSAAPGLYEQFIIENQGNGIYGISSVHHGGLYLRMDGSNVKAYAENGSGEVTCHFDGIRSYEKFRLEKQADGTYAIASVQFPGVYLRMDGRALTESSESGDGIVNCQWGVSEYEKFHIFPRFQEVKICYLDLEPIEIGQLLDQTTVSELKDTIRNHFADRIPYIDTIPKHLLRLSCEKKILYDDAHSLFSYAINRKYDPSGESIVLDMTILPEAYYTQKKELYSSSSLQPLFEAIEHLYEEIKHFQISIDAIEEYSITTYHAIYSVYILQPKTLISLFMPNKSPIPNIMRSLPLYVINPLSRYRTFSIIRLIILSQQRSSRISG